MIVQMQFPKKSQNNNENHSQISQRIREWNEKKYNFFASHEKTNNQFVHVQLTVSQTHAISM